MTVPGHAPTSPAGGWQRYTAPLGRSLSLVRAAAPRELVAVAVGQALTAVATVAQLLILRRLLHILIDHAGHGHLTEIAPDLALLAVATLLGNLATGLAGERQRFVVELVRRYAMARILDVTTTVDFANFESPAFNDALSRARQHALVRPIQVVGGLMSVLQATLSGVVMAVTLAAIAPIVLPILLLGSVPTVWLLRRNSRDLHDVDRKLTTVDRQRWYLEDVMSTTAGAKETRTFRLASFLGPMHAALADRRVDDYRVLIRRRSTRVGLSSVVSALVVCACLALLAGLVLDGHMSAATATVAAVAMSQLGSSLRMAGSGMGQVFENSLFLNEVDDFLRMRPEGDTARTASPAAPVPPQRLSVSGLTFAYPGTDRAVLHDISVDIPAGQVLAIVGENGSGKTTLTKLLCGLYPPPPGTVHWDGTDATVIDPDEWRSRFSVVFQDFMRYELSARHNIAVGRHEHGNDVAAVRQAALTVDADRYITALGEGYETILSRGYAGGADLSLGQWQRVALARAFFSDAPVLILDEPTSALDPRVEQELLQRVRSFAGRRTVVLVSHRLSSVRAADDIVVLREGHLVEHGSHDALMRLGGHYAELFELQASAYRAAETSGQREPTAV